jgi:hypothetical protein
MHQVQGVVARAKGEPVAIETIHVPARIARPQRRRVLHLPAHWPWAEHWIAMWKSVFATATGPPVIA